jgi:gliding motility-associated lipoprotein GldH
MIKGISFKINLYRTILGVLLSAFLLSACSENFIFEKKHVFPNAKWTYQDSVNFDFTILDTLKIYNLYLEIEHGDTYPYQNIYTMTQTLFPEGQRPSQLLNVNLAEQSGKWEGKKSGENWTQRVDLQKGAFFSQSGNYTLTLRQYMRTDSLPDVKSIKFAVEQTSDVRKPEDMQIKKEKKEKKGNAEAQRKYLPVK